MADENNNKKIIADTLAAAMEEPTFEKTRELLISVIEKLKNYLNSLDSFYDIVEKGSGEIIQAMRAAEAKESAISYALYKEFKDKKNNEIGIDSLLQDGYRLLDEIREFFTGETIVYQIGVESKGVLYENQLTIDEILQYSMVMSESRAQINNLFKLRMTNKSGLIDFLKNKAETTEISTDRSTVYSAIREFLYESTDGTKKNFGNAYEAYQLIVARRQGKNTIPPPVTKNEIVDTLVEVRKNTASSMKGGDYLNMQIKFFEGAPSLITTSLIRKTIQKLIKSLENFIQRGNATTLRNNLKKIFIKDLKKVSDDVEREAIEKATKKLTEVIGKLNIK